MAMTRASLRGSPALATEPVTGLLGMSPKLTRVNASEPLADPRHEAFASHFAVSGNAAAAWLVAGGANRKAASRQGARWVRRADIAARVAWLRANGARLRGAGSTEDGATPLTVGAMRRFLARIVRARIAETPDDSDLWQEIRESNGRVLRRLPDKLRAIALDNKLAGEGLDPAAAVPVVVDGLLDRVFGPGR